MKTKHVEDFSIACMDEGSIPSDSTITPTNTEDLVYEFGTILGVFSSYQITPKLNVNRS